MNEWCGGSRDLKVLSSVVQQEDWRERDAIRFFLVPCFKKNIKFAKQNRFLSNEMGCGVRGYFFFLSYEAIRRALFILLPSTVRGRL